ncbi:mRNA-degrading endonuclease toxin of MazEF toxin-antitoxin module [Weissella uvarum]|uniref:type II toxin-antitoxin system PemK/MazF family toxin n=1 Tax=Weissella uvarum TaxID=1479233 RepID=UPI0030B80F4E|nr:mRNA-degrading endonuclease toxin of MazEF toxin-antitoxin module [Weissella uvarum]
MVERHYPRQGQIIYINFSPSAGHEIIKRRPAVVISNNIIMETSHFGLGSTNLTRPL